MEQFIYELADILQINLGSKHQGSDIGSCRQYPARRGVGSLVGELRQRQPEARAA